MEEREGKGGEGLGTQAIMGKRTKSGVLQLSRVIIFTGRCDYSVNNCKRRV